MCERCKTAEQELRAFLQELEQKYPGVEVDGKVVPPSHHVFVALASVGDEYFQKELDFVRQEMGMDKGPLMQVREGRA